MPPSGEKYGCSLVREENTHGENRKGGQSTKKTKRLDEYTRAYRY